LIKVHEQRKTKKFTLYYSEAQFSKNVKTSLIQPSEVGMQELLKQQLSFK